MTQPREPRVRTDFSAGEVRSAIMWLSVGALISVLLEVASLGTLWGIPSIAGAFLFNGVVGRTGRLWASKSEWVPLAAWILGFALLCFGVEVTAALAAENSIRAAVLFAAGCLGGVWPLARRR